MKKGELVRAGLALLNTLDDAALTAAVVRGKVKPGDPPSKRCHDMKAIVVMNPKGGSGKSTIATHLAGYFARHGSGAMLGDIDRQQSSRDWLAIRPDDAPHISSWEVGPDHMARPPKGVSHVVLDTPAGLSGKQLEKVVKVAARIVVPIQASPFDMWAVEAFLQEVMASRPSPKAKPISRWWACGWMPEPGLPKPCASSCRSKRRRC